MKKEELTMQRRNMAAARKIQRISQQQQHPVKYEQVKLNNRLATAKYDKMKREKRNLMSKEEVIADKLLKAEARRRQRIKQKLKSLGLENVERTLEVTFSDD